MDQIPQSIINSILGGALAALGWFARQIWDAIKELRSDLARLREELPPRYVPKDEVVPFARLSCGQFLCTLWASRAFFTQSVRCSPLIYKQSQRARWI